MQATTNKQPDITMSLLQKKNPQPTTSQKLNPSAGHKLAMMQANQAAMAAMASAHTKRASQLARLQIPNGKSPQVRIVQHFQIFANQACNLHFVNLSFNVIDMPLLSRRLPRILTQTLTENLLLL
jgi:hypothetical protein